MGGFRDEVRDLLDERLDEGAPVEALMCVIGRELLAQLGFNDALEMLEAHANEVSEFMLDAATEERRLKLH